MNPSSPRRLMGGRMPPKDRVAVLLLLVAGAIGVLTVFLIPNPVRILAPEIPLIAPQDWPGSRVSTKLFSTESWQISPTAPWSPFLWEERRGFSQSLGLYGGDVNASTSQTVVWYADPAENTEAWSQLDTGTYNGWPIIERSSGADKPASFLACSPETSIPPQCWYLAYWDHWFTAVFFWRQEGEGLLRRDIRQLSAIADQRLMSAPEEPCFWFLCTAGRGEKR